LENPEFQEFVQALNPAYKVPSHDKIGSSVLNEVYADVRQKMMSYLKGTKGVLLQDGWSTNQNDAVVAHCIQSGDNIFVLNTCLPGTEKSDADYCFLEITKAINQAKEEFECEIVGVVVDNCSTMTALQKQVRDKCPGCESYGCNCHLCNLLGKHFTPSDLQQDVNKVQVYMKNHHFTVAMLKELKAKQPVLPGTTRWNAQMDSFLNYLENQPNYLTVIRKMREPDGSKEKTKFQEIKAILNDSELYSKVEKAVKTLKQIGVALDKVNFTIIF
jgi:hypothetical protein